MIELGKIQKLKVERTSDFGVYLMSPEGDHTEVVLLPRKQVPPDVEIGDEIEVFVYKDSEDRIISTTQKPLLTIGQVANLKVAEITRIGAFLDWGLQKDLFLPFKQQVGKVAKGSTCLVGLYVDKSERLCATMKIYDLLSSQTPYCVNGRANGIIYNITDEFGAFVAVEGKYHGLIPKKEFIGEYKIGDQVEVRIQKIRADGKLELSLRKQLLQQIEVDAQKIMTMLNLNDGQIPFNDKSDAEIIKREMAMSKASFKRAVGKLLKEGAIEIIDNGIKRRW